MFPQWQISAAIRGQRFSGPDRALTGCIDGKMQYSDFGDCTSSAAGFAGEAWF
jgi:hypothetical protein